MDVPQQFAAIAEFFQVGERAEMERFLDRIVRRGARVDDHADLIVEVADPR